MAHHYLGNKVQTPFSKTKSIDFSLYIPTIFSPSALSVCSVMSDSLRPHGLQPTKFFCPWNFPSKNTGMGCHFLPMGISPPKDQNRVSCMVDGFFTTVLPRKPSSPLTFSYYILILVTISKCITLSTFPFLDTFYSPCPDVILNPLNPILISLPNSFQLFKL